MGIFDGKKTLKSAPGGPIARTDGGSLGSVGGGGSFLRERDGHICSVSGFPILRVRENLDGTKSISDLGGQVMFRVSKDGKDMTDIHGWKQFSLE